MRRPPAYDFPDRLGVREVQRLEASRKRASARDDKTSVAYLDGRIRRARAALRALGVHDIDEYEHRTSEWRS